MTVWSPQETRAIIALWSEETIQNSLEECHRNMDVYRTLARQLKEAIGDDFNRTAAECRGKIKRLKTLYNAERRKRAKFGAGGTSKFIFFNQMDAVLGARPMSQCHNTFSTLGTAGETEGGSEEKEPESPVKDDESDTQSDNDSVTSGRVKRKTTMDDIKAIMEAFASYEDRAQEKYFELEAKVRKLEREVEDQRRRDEDDREDIRRKEDRDFQLKMMEIMMTHQTSMTSQIVGMMGPQFAGLGPIPGQQIASILSVPQGISASTSKPVASPLSVAPILSVPQGISARTSKPVASPSSVAPILSVPQGISASTSEQVASPFADNGDASAVKQEATEDINL